MKWVSLYLQSHNLSAETMFKLNNDLCRYLLNEPSIEKKGTYNRKCSSLTVRMRYRQSSCPQVWLPLIYDIICPNYVTNGPFSPQKRTRLSRTWGCRLSLWLCRLSSRDSKLWPCWPHSERAICQLSIRNAHTLEIGARNLMEMLGLEQGGRHISRRINIIGETGTGTEGNTAAARLAAKTVKQKQITWAELRQQMESIQSFYACSQEMKYCSEDVDASDGIDPILLQRFQLVFWPHCPELRKSSVWPSLLLSTYHRLIICG